MELKFSRRLASVFNWLVPRRCLDCGIALQSNTHPCCSDCYALLPFHNNCCHRCGRGLGVDEDCCGRCLAAPPPFDECFCAFRYQPPLSSQIQRFKYADRPDQAKVLATALAVEILAHDLQMPDLLIPVPIHINRLRQRGYNQSLLLTRELSKLLRVPYSNKIIEKHRATDAQVRLSLKQRERNVKGSFRLCVPPKAGSVAVIDDVITTGSTATEITKILKRNGVDYVQIWGIAHTN